MAWRKWRGVLAALFVVVLAAGPTLDTLVCADDVVAAADVAGADPHDGDEAQEVCQHGHCHPGGAMAPVMAMAQASYAGSAAMRLPAGDGDEIDRQFGLMRPPRA